MVADRLREAGRLGLFLIVCLTAATGARGDELKDFFDDLLGGPREEPRAGLIEGVATPYDAATGGLASATAPHDGEAALQLRRAYRAIADRQWAVAAERLEALLERAGDRVVLKADGAIAVVADEANALLRRLPEEERRRLERSRGPVANRILDDALRDRRLDLLRVVAERFAFTEAGRVARNRLGSRALDRGDTAEAIRLLRPLAEEIERSDRFDAKLEFLDRLAGPGLRFSQSDELSRSRRDGADASAGSILTAWKTPVGTAGFRRAVATRRSWAARDGGPLLTTGTAVADAGVVVLPAADRLVAVGAADGRPVWETGPVAPGKLRDDAVVAAVSGGLWDSPVVGGGMLFVIEKGEPLRAPSRRSGRFRFMPRGTTPTVSDAVVAYDVRSGAVVWRVGLGHAAEEPDAIGTGTETPAVALTPPTYVDGDLYLIVERRDERLLLRLGGEGGRTVHRTLLAQVPPADPRTRSTGKNGAAIGGVTAGPFAVYCPTGLGWFVAVDRETGRIRWASRYEGDHARPRRWGFDDDESAGEWMPVAPITGDGVVVFAPPDGEAVFGVARDSGRIAWLIARVNGLYVASAGPRTVAVVSPEEVAAYDVATGIPRWRTSLPPVGGVGTVAADGREFWLTLATGEVVSLATSDGSLTRGVVPAGGPAGRLTAVGGGRFVVHGGDDVALLTPTSRSASAADAAELSVTERTARGARAVAAGDAAAAIAWVDIDDRPPADAKARAVLRAAYERLLAADPTDAAMRARFRELADGPSDATKADLFEIDAAVRSGQDRAVAEAALARLLGSADPGRLVPGGETGLRVTLLTRLASLWTGLGRPARPAEAVSAREDLDRADRLRVRRLFRTGRPDASAELVGSARLVGQFDRRLGGEVGPAVVRPASFGPAGPRDDDGRGVRVVRSGANGVETAVPLAICGESAPLAAAESWVFRRDVRRLVGRDGDGRTRASVPVGPPERSNGRLVAVPAFYSAVAVGEALFAVTDGRMTACGRVDGRLLWSLPLPEGVFEPAGPEHIRGVASDPESLGVTPLVTAAALTSRDGPWGPRVAVGAGGVAVLDGTTLTLHDAVTGRGRWVREGLPASAALRVGDREVLVVAGDEAVFFNAEDGGRLSSPADGEVVAAIGPRWVMRDAPSGDGRSLSLRLVDVRRGGSGPTLRLPVDSSVGFVPGGLLVAVNRAGRVTLADVVTGDSDAVARVEGLGGPADDVAAFWSMGRLFVGVSGRRPSFLNVNAPAVHIDGVLACCDPREGGVVWTGKVSGRVPVGLPEHGFALPVIDGDIKRLDGTPYATLELTLFDPSAGTEIDRLSIARAVPAEVAAVVCRKDSVSFLSRAETLRVEPIARGLIPAPAVLRDADAAADDG